MIDQPSITIDHGTYVPVAIYYEASDSVEYLREDAACVYRRIDETLTLALEMESRTLVGFRLKGFKNFYLRHLNQKHQGQENFLKLVTVLEEALELIGNRIFVDSNIADAYQNAYRIASEDQVMLKNMPRVA
ncbi:hypothetical protein [Bosea sp. (in: a-proteobacteria)]|uniref:hypothetical protein n=1 Tax=Bosea sp. (in: a-proteobacteria) TaxID=1871050 RepID=UPI0027352F36|nr:hypothetical protein [Bosea sp. (in: a-proteobacteria)]MDP3406739.1 hypothetical protein [Bosea sp. (in: a-proteobacteria)]